MDAKITWNPVKNGYPEKHRGFYLVTVGIGMPEPVTSIAEWIKPEFGKGEFYLYNSQFRLKDLGFCVKAWAELPEPWREKEDGSNDKGCCEQFRMLRRI